MRAESFSMEDYPIAEDPVTCIKPSGIQNFDILIKRSPLITSKVSMTFRLPETQNPDPKPEKNLNVNAELNRSESNSTINGNDSTRRNKINKAASVRKNLIKMV